MARNDIEKSRRYRADTTPEYRMTADQSPAARAKADIQRELFSLCEATANDCALIAERDTETKVGAFARGRIKEAKSIRDAMGEVFREIAASIVSAEAKHVVTSETIQRALDALRTPDASLARVPNTIRQSIADVVESLDRSVAKWKARAEAAERERAEIEKAACDYLSDKHDVGHCGADQFAEAGNMAQKE